MVAGETRVYRSGSWHRRGRDPIYPSLNDGFILGTTRPDATNTGPRIPESSMTTVTGTITLNSPQIYENKVIEGRIVVTASNVTIRNCIIRMPSATSAIRGIFCATAGAVNTLIEYVRIEVPAGNRSYHQGYCIQGSGFTARRCDFSGTVDGMSVVGVNQRAGATIEGCYIHDLPVYTAGSVGIVHPSDTITHNDGMQVEGNLTNVVINGNTIGTGHTSGILVTQDSGTYDVGVTLTNNWFDVDDTDFGSILNIKMSMTTLNQLVIQNNRFTALYPAKARIIMDDDQLAATTITSHGANRNTFLDGSYPVPVYNGTSQIYTYGGA